MTHFVTPSRKRYFGAFAAVRVPALLRFCTVLMTSIGAVGQAAAQDTGAYFEEHIRPLLAAKCAECHGTSNSANNLRVDSRAAFIAGGDGGPVVVPGDVDNSLLMRTVRGETPASPPEHLLPQDEVDALARWVADGAIWPEHPLPIRGATETISEQDRAWWAFRPLTKPALPTITNDAASINPVDRFIFRRLAERGMTPAPRATQEELVRRVYFDVLGLPPTPDEITAFVDDPSPNAWENLVDRLLDDPRYGEHWARFWLDLVRYAESDGWNKDSYRPNLWRYRDYVVNAFNHDKPYPQFVREQLAGDEIEDDNPEHLIATGFLRLGIYEYNQRDAKGQWNDIMNEMTDVAGDVFLGLSMSCSRCHDHKFDPIPQSDYFSLRAFFEPIVWRDDVPAATEAQQAQWRSQQAVWEETAPLLHAAIDALCAPYYKRKWDSTVDKFPLDIQACFYKPQEERTSWEHQMAYLVSRQFYEEGTPALNAMSKRDKEKLAALEKRLAKFDKLKPPPLPQAMSVTDFDGTPSPTVPPGGDAGDAVAPSFLSVLSTDAPGEDLERPGIPDSTGRRTALAEWIGRPDNPVTTRVFVNRIWQQHFGRGIATTPNDFGRMGQPPTHPELLDWLTATFVENGWSMKHLHKLILMSSTWQQSATHPSADEYQLKDPGDNLYWRAPVRRLSAEQLRDAMLLASGELDLKLGGPSVKADTPRRALYVRSLRNSPDEFLHAFDRANGLTSVAVRDNTTTPTQALLMLNNNYVLGRSAALAERLLARESATPWDLLSDAFRLTWGRAPTTNELAKAEAFVIPVPEPESPVLDEKRLTDFCHVLFNSNEFMYLD